MPAPVPGRRPLTKEKLAAALSTAKAQTYSDTSPSASRAPVTSSGRDINTLSWSPLGTLIAVADSRVLRVWNPERNNVKYSTELKLSPTSDTLATPTTTGSRYSRPAQPSHVSNTAKVVWNPVKEAELTSVGADGMVRFWDVRTKGQMVGEIKLGQEAISVTWRPGGEELVVGTKHDALIQISRQTLSQISKHQQEKQTNDIAFSNSGHELLVTTADSCLKILDYPSMDTIHTLRANTPSCTAVQQCPRGRYIAIGGTDALITLWDTTDFVCRNSLADMPGAVRSLSFSFDGSFVCGGSDEGNGIMVAYVETGEYIYTIPTSRPAELVAWHPGRYWLAYSGDSSGLKIVGVTSGNIL